MTSIRSMRWIGWFSLAIFFSGVQVGRAAEDLVSEFEFKEVARPAEPSKGGEANAPPQRSDPDQLTFDYRMAQVKYKLYECLMLSVSLIVSLLIVLRFITKTTYSAANIVSASGLTFIIFGTIFLVLLADAEAQLTASMGILGAIAGYLFGTMRRGEGGG